MTTPTLCPDENRLLGMLDCELEPPQQEQVTEHVSECVTCQTRLEALVTRGLREDLEFDQVATHLRNGLTDIDLMISTDDVGQMTETLLSGDARTGDIISLDFLQPSDLPDSLGRLGQYEVTEVIGRGGMGIALKARDTRLDRIVAVKVLAPELASNPTARKRFLREAKAAAAISHDHVVTVHAVEPGDLPYLAMEYIDGYSLQQKIDREGPLPVQESLRISMQAARGLAAAHDKGLIHHDIKPANMLQNGVERVQITDFGLARAIDDVTITRTGEVRGTPQFMSPEQARGESTDPRSDLFSLGAAMYAMCTGRPPFRGDSTMGVLHRVCNDAPREIREINPEIPEWLVSIINRLLEKNREDRFQTAEEVAELLEQCLAHLQQPTVVPLPELDGRPAAKTQPTRRKWYTGAIVALMLLIGLGMSEATGVTQLAGTVLRITLGEGTLVIDVDDPNVEVSLDGEELTISGAGIREVKLRPGQYQFRATKDGRPLKQELVTITRGGEEVVRITRETAESSADEQIADSGPLEPGYISLFDGRTLNGWQGDSGAFAVEDGILVSNWRGELFTAQQFSDFVLRFEFRLSPAANNGIGVRAPMVGNPSLEGFEIQILDDASYGQLADYNYHGSIWGVVPADRGHLKPVGEWNQQEIRCLGTRVKVRLNGTLIVDTDLDAITDPPDGKYHPGLKRKSGHIALLGVKGRTEFKNIRVRDLRGEEKAFVILDENGSEVSKYASLSAAIASSSAGNVIEIHGNGPFVTEPISIEHPLALRAADGFRPIINGDPDNAKAANAPLLNVTSPFVLEGIELKFGRGSKAGTDIVKATAPLKVTNCSFTMLDSNGTCVRSSSSGVLQNCELVNSKDGSSFDWATHATDSFRVQNCVLTGRTVVQRFDGTIASLQLIANTIVRPEAWHGALSLKLHSQRKPPAHLSSVASLRIESSSNVFDSATELLTFSQSTDQRNQLQLDQVRAQLPQILEWREERNLYRRGSAMLNARAGDHTEIIFGQDLQDWNRFWHLAATGSFSGIIRYQGGSRYSSGNQHEVDRRYGQGNLYEEVQFTPEKLTPADFRLRPDSAGSQDRPDGRDIGAHIGMVGPGEAYERWKASSAYDEWQEETRELMKTAPRH